MMGYPVQHKLVPSLPVRVDTHLQTLFNQSPDLFCIIEPDGTFGQLNPAWQSLLNWTPEALRSCLWIELVHPEDVEATLRVLATRKVSPEPFYFKNRYRHRDGSYRWLSWSWWCHGEEGWNYAVAREVSTNWKPKVGAGIEGQSIKLERLHYLISHSPAILYSCKISINYSFTFVSENAAAVLGYSAWEFLADEHFFSSRIHPQDAPRVFANLPRLFERGHHVHEYRFQHKNGQYRWIQDELKLVRDDSGNPVEMVGSWIDITDRKLSEVMLQQQTKALQEAHQRLRFHVENSPLAVVEWDNEFRLQYWSQQAEKIFGWKAQEVMGKRPEDWQFVYEEDIEAVNRVMARLIEGKESRNISHNRNFKKDGSVVDCEWYNSVLFDEFGNLLSIRSQIQDVSERKQAEVALSQNAQQLKRLNEELWQSNSELEQFAYVASHDLQEPLRAVNSYTQLLAQKYQGNLDAKADKYIHYIVDGATRMQQLINDLLEFSRVGARGKPLQPTKMEVVLARVMDNLNVAIAQKQAIITYDSLPMVMGDYTQLIQLFQNLLSNAIKFHREEPPQVHISAAQMGKEWVFSVRDNGIGIAPEHFERIFTIFQRLHPRREYPGTGIGLAVCKKIAERHRGRIWLESEVGAGTTFYFTIACEK
ncbi:MAG TPA: hypothetical protein DDZ80_18040 [Cyanobacteria bacterium UBA8803]|nr:hypothetical protein [Cyanobacteria bacterium UBA9273]HBL60287.1 hypothetical protein [Cyanobacteria bacterium UBA8803]